MPFLPTARSYAGTNHVVTISCRDCGHSGDLDLDAMAAGPLADVPLLHLQGRMRCTECGARNSLGTVSYDDPRFPREKPVAKKVEAPEE